MYIEIHMFVSIYVHMYIYIHMYICIDIYTKGTFVFTCVTENPSDRTFFWVPFWEQISCHEETYAAKQKQVKAMQSELHTYQSQACGVAMRSGVVGWRRQKSKHIARWSQFMWWFHRFSIDVKPPNIVFHVKPPIM